MANKVKYNLGFNSAIITLSKNIIGQKIVNFIL